MGNKYIIEKSYTKLKKLAKVKPNKTSGLPVSAADTGKPEFLFGFTHVKVILVCLILFNNILRQWLWSFAARDCNPYYSADTILEKFIILHNIR